MTVRCILSALVLTIFGGGLRLLVSKWNQISAHDQPDDHANEVLFFPDSDYPCDKITLAISKSSGDIAKLCVNQSCKRLHGRPDERPSSLIKFLKQLAGAKETIDLCIYLLTQETLSRFLRDLHNNNNVRIRIITDSNEDDAQASQIGKLKDCGIEVKTNKRNTGSLMHHKFVIIDGKTLLAGSFNWTNKAVTSNYEAVIVSTHPSLVKPFCDKFESLWQSFVPHLARSTQHLGR